MPTRTYLIAGAATVLLAAGSVAALAAARPAAIGASSCTVPSLAGSQVRVTLADMGGMMGGARSGMPGRWMALAATPRTVAAGTVSFVAENRGVRTHELLVVPLADGAAAGSRPVGRDHTVDETGSLGEASRGCGAGHGDGIAPGQAGWVTLTLRPGRYELLCNEPGHYAAGMSTELDVR